MNIRHYSTQNAEIKAAMVERVQRTIKGKIMRYMLENKTKRYIDQLQNFVDSYNSTPNSVFKIYAPNQVTEENSAVIRDYLYPTMVPQPMTQPKFKVGQIVRTSMERRAIGDKEHDINWSIPTYRIISISHREPDREVYRLQDTYDGEILEGTWYREELAASAIQEEFRIEKVLKEKRGPGGKKLLYVKWQGYKKPSWISENDLV